MQCYRSSRFTTLLLLFCIIVPATLSGCLGTHARETQPVQPTQIPDIPSTAGGLPDSNTKSQGTEVRIISQNDDVTELLVAIGAADNVIGITGTAVKKAYLTRKVNRAQSIGDWLWPDIETILSLKPDVIISYSTSRPRNLEKLSGANISLAYCDAYRINTLVSDARMLGVLTGHEEGANKYIAFHEKYESLVRSRIPDDGTGNTISVYAEAYSDYSVMTQRSAGGRILEILHVQNIYGNHSSDWATVSPEWVVGRNPDVIIKFSTDPAKGENLTSVRERVLHRPGFSNISAVKTGRVYVLNGEIGSSPRAVIGLIYTAKAIYPDRFTDIDPQDVLAEYDREFVPDTGTADAFEPVLRVEKS